MVQFFMNVFQNVFIHHPLARKKRHMYNGNVFQNNYHAAIAKWTSYGIYSKQAQQYTVCVACLARPGL